MDRKLRSLSQDGNTDNQWEECKESVKIVADEVLGLQPAIVKKSWFDEECETITALKNEARKLTLQRRHTRSSEDAYKALRRQEKRVHRRKKRQQKCQELQAIEELRSQNDIRKLYNLVNRLRKPFKPQPILVALWGQDDRNTFYQQAPALQNTGFWISSDCTRETVPATVNSENTY
ncbi:hypothetical protein GE061_014387 [Apolygus lucorum]|uniref:Uncharacterized protein n=1 Tax=Apolygus lucorum TaxID=248454 RepID=A0A8S9XQH5_APOLU|nr:hypothetical protein GE061_014387 [Apolygus lucorum]